VDARGDAAEQSEAVISEPRRSMGVSDRHASIMLPG